MYIWRRDIAFFGIVKSKERIATDESPRQKRGTRGSQVTQVASELVIIGESDACDNAKIRMTPSGEDNAFIVRGAPSRRKGCRSENEKQTEQARGEPVSRRLSQESSRKNQYQIVSLNWSQWKKEDPLAGNNNSILRITGRKKFELQLLSREWNATRTGEDCSNYNLLRKRSRETITENGSYYIDKIYG